MEIIKHIDTNASTKRARGRPEGSMSRLAKEARTIAQQTGDLPHEILLRIARGELIRQKQIDQDGVITEIYLVPDLDKRIDAAKAAAPYFAPKISTIEVVTGVSDADLDEFIARLAEEAGVSLGIDGESEAEETAGSARVRKKLNGFAASIFRNTESDSE